MTESRSSRPAWAIDVPRPVAFSAEFQYNFFTRDELTNDSGDNSVVSIDDVSLASQARVAEVIDERTRIPRFVKFNFVPVRFTPANRASDPFRLRRISPVSVQSIFLRRHLSQKQGLVKSQDDVSIRENIDKIVPEETFSNFAFTGVEFQDTRVDGKLFFIVSGAVASRLNSSQPDRAVKPRPFVSDPAGLSFLEVAQFLNRNTPPSIDGELATTIATQPDAKGTKFRDEQNRKAINDAFEDVKNVAVRVQMNNRHVHKMLRYLVNESTTIYCDEIRSLLPAAEQLERGSNRDDRQWSLDQYNATLPFVSLRERDPGSVSVLSSRIVGYVIDKFEVTDKQLIRHDPIIIENDAIDKSVDLAVRYNTAYAYTIRAVAAVEIPAVVDDESQKLYTATVLVSSRPSPQQQVQTIEDVPPPHPADFNIAWDFSARAPRLTWNLPPNPQRDVKKIQVFRRRSLDKPFELIRMFDFNDATPALPEIEKPTPQLVDFSDQPVMSFLDGSFDPERSAIYALCAIDAHGLSSNYTMQFEVRFDRFSNRLDKKMVSFSGAPKPYPNLLLKQDMFLDAIRDSGHTHVKIAFDPEFISLRDGTGDDVRFLATDRTGGKYRLQLINIDFQKQQDIDLNLTDRRTRPSVSRRARRDHDQGARGQTAGEQRAPARAGTGFDRLARLRDG